MRALQRLGFRVSLSRLRGSAPTLAAILVVVALLCGFSVATTVYIDQQGTAGLRAELATRAGADLALRASLDRAEDAARQDDEVRSAISRTFESTGVAFTVTRSLDAEAFFALPSDVDETTSAETDTTDTPDLRESGSATAATIADLESRADFESGTVAAGETEVAVQAEAAAELGLEVGDEVLLNEVPFTVSGTWRALDSLDPRWYGDETVVTGGSERLGPFAITEEAWSRFSAQPTATWTVVPASIDEFTATNRGSVTAAWDAAKDQWRGDISEYESLDLQRRLARTLDEFGVRIEGLRAIEPVAAVLVAGSALVVLSQLVQLLVATREQETALFWARGQSPGSIARRTALEVATSAALGAAVGVGAVVLWLALADALPQLYGVRSTAAIVPAVVVVGAVLFAGVSSYRSALSVTTATKGGRGGGRVRRAAVPGVVILVSVAAALAVWQLRLYGSPLTPSATGASSIDPIAVVAPAAALVAVVLAALAAFPEVVSLYSRRGGDAGVTTHLSARTLALHTGRVAAPLVVVALAVGSATVGAAFSATWSQLFDRTADLHAGADIRVSSRFDPLSPGQLDAVAATEGVEAIAPLDVQILSVGTVTGSILAASPLAVRELATTAGGTFSPEDAAAAIELEQTGPGIPEGATALTLRVEAVAFAAPPTLAAWIADSLGRLHRVAFEAPVAEPDDVLVYTAELGDVPDAVPGTLLSLDVKLPVQSYDETARFSLIGLDALVAGSEQALTLDQFWVTDTLRGQLAPPRINTEGTGFELDWGLPSVRMTATLDGTAIDAMRPGALVTERLATQLELEVDDIIAFSVRDRAERINAVVTGIVPAIPGSRTDVALLMDLAVVNHFHLRADSSTLELTDLWVKTGEPEQVRDAIRPLLPANTRVDSSADPVGRQVLGAASVALWAAALCCVLIAIVAVASASRSRLRWGRSDIASLRAIGLGARGQSAVIVRELGLVLAVATVAGLAAGALVSVLTVPELARAAVDRSYLALGTALAVDWIGLGILLGGLAVGIALILADLSRRVRVLASTSLPSEGHE